MLFVNKLTFIQFVYSELDQSVILVRHTNADSTEYWDDLCNPQISSTDSLQVPQHFLLRLPASHRLWLWQSVFFISPGLRAKSITTLPGTKQGRAESKSKKTESGSVLVLTSSDERSRQSAGHTTVALSGAKGTLCCHNSLSRLCKMLKGCRAHKQAVQRNEKKRVVFFFHI